jgi:type IV fimbrial biogenesis protein FimT
MNPLRLHRPARPQRERGFTIIELMVTLAIAGTLVGLAVPSLKGMISGRAVQAQSAALVSTLRFAKAEALKRGAPVSVCRTTPASPDSCAGTPGGWQAWMVFADSGTAGTVDAGDKKLRVENGATNGVVFPTLQNVNYVTFQSTGIVTTHSGAALPLTWKFDPTVDSGSSAFKRYQRQICLNAQGRVSQIDGNSTC